MAFGAGTGCGAVALVLELAVGRDCGELVLVLAVAFELTLQLEREPMVAYSI